MWGENSADCHCQPRSTMPYSVTICFLTRSHSHQKQPPPLSPSGKKKASEERGSQLPSSWLRLWVTYVRMVPSVRSEGRAAAKATASPVKEKLQSIWNDVVGVAMKIIALLWFGALCFIVSVLGGFIWTVNLTFLKTFWKMFRFSVLFPQKVQECWVGLLDFNEGIKCRTNTIKRWSDGLEGEGQTWCELYNLLLE